MISKVPGNESSKDLIHNEVDKIDEEKEEETPKIPLTSNNSTSEDYPNDSVNPKPGDRSHRSYLRHTKTSRMKSVNRRDQPIKESIKTEVQSKFENPLSRIKLKDSLPPSGFNQNATINPTNYSSQNRLRSPKSRQNDDSKPLTHHSSDIFKLENKINNFAVRRGSKTKRDASEPFISSLEDRRAERKTQKTAQSISTIPTIRNFERRDRGKKWEDKFIKDSKEDVKKEVEKEAIFRNFRRNYIDNDDSPKIRKKEENKFDASPQDVKSYLKTPNSVAHTVSVFGDGNMKRSLDFSDLLKTEVDLIFTIAGYSDKPIQTIESFSCDYKMWVPLDEVEVKNGRTKFATVSYCHVADDGKTSERILILGGKTSDSKRTDLIEEYDPKTNKIKEFGHLSSPMSGFAAIWVADKVYVIGGNDGKIRNQVEWLDLNTKWWSLLPSLNYKRDELSATLGPDGWLYAIGGYGGPENKWLITAERYDFDLEKWIVLSKMKYPRRALSAVSLPNGVYALGGYDGERYLNSVEKYDQESDRWVSVEPMNQKRCTLSSVSSNDLRYIYAIGGFNGSALGTVERYDVYENKWEMLPSMNSKRFMHASVRISK
jgi:hypothetical protein